MDDLIFLRKMITPTIIQIIYWVAEALVILVALYTLIKASFLQGLIMLVLGPIAVRVYCELLILLFKMNDSLSDIRNAVAKK